jgi:ATP-binding cassette subfamily B protein RaxB
MRPGLPGDGRQGAGLYLFTGRVSALINYAVEIRMLSLHAERLGDIVLSAPEVHDIADNSLSHLPPSIELRGVSFRYGVGVAQYSK